LAITGIKRATGSLTRDYGEGRRTDTEARRFRHDARRRRASTFHLANTEVTIKPLSQVDGAFASDERGTELPSGGSMLIAAISPGKRTVKGSRKNAGPKIEETGEQLVY
jgi:hypothetical protein